LTLWTAILAGLSGTGGIGALLALFIVPASKRHDDIQKRIAQLERQTARLQRSDANKGAIILVFIQRDETMVERLKQKDPTFVMEPMQEMLKRLNLSLALIVGGVEEEDDEKEEDTK